MNLLAVYRAAPSFARVCRAETIWYIDISFRTCLIIFSVTLGLIIFSETLPHKVFWRKKKIHIFFLNDVLAFFHWMTSIWFYDKLIQICWRYSLVVGQTPVEKTLQKPIFLTVYNHFLLRNKRYLAYCFLVV